MVLFPKPSLKVLRQVISGFPIKTIRLVQTFVAEFQRSFRYVFLMNKQLGKLIFQLKITKLRKKKLKSSVTLQKPIS